MEDTNGPGPQLPSPPPRLFDRLAQLSGYTWDQSTEPFHSVSEPAEERDIAPMNHADCLLYRAMITGMSLAFDT